MPFKFGKDESDFEAWKQYLHLRDGATQALSVRESSEV